MRRYFICKNTFDAGRLGSYSPIHNILEWDCFSLDGLDCDKVPSHALEIDKETAVFGLRSWGDIRSTIKVAATSLGENSEFDELSYYDTSSSAKVQIPMTDKRYKVVLNAMKLVAKVIIEDTFNARFEALDDSVSPLEKKNWQFLESDIANGEDFIMSDLAAAKDTSADRLKDLVVQKRDTYNNKVKNLFVEMNAVKQSFYRCSSIRQLNRLYEDKMGIPMPFEQAKDEQRLDPQTESQRPVSPGIKF